MRLPALLAATVAVSATSILAQGIQLPPPDLAPGQEYRVLAITAGTTQATSPFIWDYDDFVRSDLAAAPELNGLSQIWRAVGSTASDSARVHTFSDPTPPGSTGVPIYRPDGVRIANDYDQLWAMPFPSLLAPANVDVLGRTFEGEVFSGTREDGLASIAHLGASNVALGTSWSTDDLWITGGQVPQTEARRMYAISDVVRVPQIQLPPPDLAPGQPYRVLAVTVGTTEFTSTSIDDYNDFVRVDVLVHAAPELTALGTSWRAIGSTTSISARENTDTDPSPPGPTGVPIYRPDGVRIANHYDQLWAMPFPSLLAPPEVNLRGEYVGGFAASGTTEHGVASIEALGTDDIAAGNPPGSNDLWITGAAVSPTEPLPMYTISDVLTVPIPSSEVSRVGSLPNPDAFLPGVTSGPVLGRVWDPVIDHTTFFPQGDVDFMIVTLAPTDVAFPGIVVGHLLCDPTAWEVTRIVLPGTPFFFPIPDIQAFVGFPLFVQGGSAGGPDLEMHFTNALDIVIGEV